MQNKTLVRVFMMAGLMDSLAAINRRSTSSAQPANGAADSSTGKFRGKFRRRPAISGHLHHSSPPRDCRARGTPISVTVDQSVSSKTSNEGEHFDASLAAPITVGDKVVIPSGARARGTVTVAKSAGKFKGNAELGVTLDSITVNGERYSVRTTSVTESGKGRARGLQSAREAARLSEDSSERLRVAGKARQSVQVPEQARHGGRCVLPVIVILRSSPKRAQFSSFEQPVQIKGK